MQNDSLYYEEHCNNRFFSPLVTKTANYVEIRVHMQQFRCNFVS